MRVADFACNFLYESENRETSAAIMIINKCTNKFMCATYALVCLYTSMYGALGIWYI